MTPELLSVQGLSVAYRQGTGWMRVVDGVNFTLAPGEAFGLVGESGCGKSTVALQLLGFQHPSLRVEEGSVRFKGRELVNLPRPDLDKLRGDRITFVPQNPTTALDPGIRIGKQIGETFEAHAHGAGVGKLGDRVASLLSLVGLPGSKEFQRRYPHQLSGGQQQRVCIAMALACNPDLIVLDEPTTGLDVTTQEQIIALLIGLRERLGMSMVYVTHDLSLLAQIADRVGVMYAGRMVEIAPTAALFSAPRHPYTRGLVASIPRIDDVSGAPPVPLRGYLQRHTLPPGCPFSPRCDYSLARCVATPQQLEPTDEGRSVACWRWKEIPIPAADVPQAEEASKAISRDLLCLDQVSITYGRGAKAFDAARNISFTIAESETFALVGESGSGKSTIARAISGLVPPLSGSISLHSNPLPKRLKDRTKEQRRAIQFIFQNPDASLNPRARIGSILARPLDFFFRSSPTETGKSVNQALSDVRLDASYAGRFGDQLSGGERQRVAIARALVAKPLILLCDEILSALDVSVQANILALLRRLKRQHRIAMLIISHDLAVVRMLADRVAVLFRGEIMETGTREEVFSAPFHPYTHSLLQAVPSPRKRKPAPPKITASEVLPMASGCVYAGRCPWQLGKICETDRPPWRQGMGSHRIRCHLPLDKLTALAEWPAWETSSTSKKTLQQESVIK